LVCGRCEKEARWERVFQDKFVDPHYYGVHTVTTSPMHEIEVEQRSRAGRIALHHATRKAQGFPTKLDSQRGVQKEWCEVRHGEMTLGRVRNGDSRSSRRNCGSSSARIKAF
jgi:hypothetical protein